MTDTNTYGYEEDIEVTERFVPLAYDENADHHPVAVPGATATAPVDSANDEAINSIAATVDGALRRIAVLEDAVRSLQIQAVTQPVPVAPVPAPVPAPAPVATEPAPVVSEPSPAAVDPATAVFDSQAGVTSGVVTTEAPADVSSSPVVTEPTI